MPAKTFLADGGAIGALLRARDWSRSPLGTPAAWPQPLKTLVEVMLTANQPMFVAWGPGRTLLYNDAYAEILAAKHPEAMGRDFLEVWSEIRADLVPIVEAAYAGQPVQMDDIALVLHRRGYPEEAHFSFSYTPVHDEAGQVAGFFCPCLETTRVVLAERERAAERERLGRMFDQAPGFMAMLSGPDHVFDLTNQAYLRLIGHRDVVGRPLREALPELAGQGFYELLDAVYASGERHVAERVPIRLLNAPGLPAEQRVLDFIYEPVRDGAGAVSGIFVEGQDVTDRVRAETELRASEERARRIVEGVKDYSVFITDADGIVTDWTPGAEAIFGWTADEIVGQSADLLFTPEDRAAGVPAGELGLAREAGFAPDERWHLRRDGSRFYANGSVRPLHGPDGKVTGFIKIARDETERRTTDAALRASEARMRAVVEAAPVGLVFADQFGRITGANARVEEILGAPIRRSDGVERYREDFVAFHADGRQVDGHEYPLAHVVQGHVERSELEVQVQLPDGSLRWVRYIATPVRDERSEVIGAVVASLDIDREKRFAESLTREVEAAVIEREAVQDQLRHAQKMEAMGQLTGGVAHDFNNLLTPIIGSLDRLVTRGVGDARERRLMAGALESAERAKTLVQRLLAFARRQPLQPVAVDVRQLVEGMAELIGSTLGPTIAVQVDLAVDLPPAKADPNQLEMALLNLAVNARDAMPDGGRLTIAASRESVRGRHRASPGLKLGHYVRLAVTDTGVGMDTSTLARAVEPFFSTKGIGKGTGLGLSMTHGLAGQLGGGLTIDSTPGQGTTVALWLPLSAEPIDAADEQRTFSLSSTAPRGRALLVDDEELVRMSTADMLADLGFDVLETASAGEALKHLQEGAGVDILVTDHLMPGMTGAELARAARVLRPGLPVLIVSGYAEAEGVAPDLPRLVKPFRIVELAERVASLMPVETISTQRAEA